MRKMCTVSSSEYKKIYCSIKETLKDMYELGGRDTEKDIYGKYGGYKTKMSKKTVEKPCPVCGGEIIKKAYLGGSVYYCPSCQKI